MTDLRIVKTRTNIKNSLIDLLAEKNVSKITVTELAEKAMINRKTFYRHYNTVQDVVDDINYDIINDVISHAKKSDRDGNNLVNQLNFIGISIVENKEQINKILKNSPEVFGSGRSVELLKRFIEVSIRPVLNFKNETKLKIIKKDENNISQRRWQGKYLTDVENRAPSGADENGSQGATCLQNEGSFEIYSSGKFD